MKDNLLESIKDLEIDKKTEMDNMLKSLQESKTTAIKEMIRDINEQLKNRDVLDKDILGGIDKLKTQLNNFIMEVSANIDIATNPEGVKAIADLRKKAVEIEELSLAEKLNFWRDTANLKKELREHSEELIKTESKEDILDTLI